jgi:hypothetical protein
MRLISGTWQQQQQHVQSVAEQPNASEVKSQVGVV